MKLGKFWLGWVLVQEEKSFKRQFGPVVRICLFENFYSIILPERQGEKRKNRKIEISLCQLTPRQPTIARAEPRPSLQEPGQSRDPTRMAGKQLLELSPTATQGAGQQEVFQQRKQGSQAGSAVAPQYHQNLKNLPYILKENCFLLVKTFTTLF